MLFLTYWLTSREFLLPVLPHRGKNGILFFIDIFYKHKFLFDSYLCKRKSIIPIPYSRKDIHIHMVLNAALRKKSSDDKPVNPPGIVAAYVPALVWQNFCSLLMHFGSVSPISYKPDSMISLIFFIIANVPLPYLDNE